MNKNSSNTLRNLHEWGFTTHLKGEAELLISWISRPSGGIPETSQDGSQVVLFGILTDLQPPFNGYCWYFMLLLLASVDCKPFPTMLKPDSLFVFGRFWVSSSSQVGDSQMSQLSSENWNLSRFITIIESCSIWCWGNCRKSFGHLLTNLVVPHLWPNITGSFQVSIMLPGSHDGWLHQNPLWLAKRRPAKFPVRLRKETTEWASHMEFYLRKLLDTGYVHK